MGEVNCQNGESCTKIVCKISNIKKICTTYELIVFLKNVNVTVVAVLTLVDNNRN